MLTRELSHGVALRLLEERDVDELYALVEANRAYLAEWMPWAATETRGNAAAFIRLTRIQVGENNGLNTAITVHGRLAGMAGVGQIDWANRSTEIGYWLAAEHQGRGIMTAAVAAHLEHLFGALGLNRVTIKAATGNARSRAIAERLGFTLEGVEREAEWIGTRVHDLARYAILAVDWMARPY